jgi:hypothetical protein
MRRGLKDELQAMDEYEFEHFVADVWEAQGWDCTVSQASNDGGIDVTATKSTPYPQKKLIQAKRYSSGNNVGSKAIQQYNSLKAESTDVDSAVVVTTSQFTSPAESKAETLNVKLVDGDDLVALVDELGVEHLVEQYDTGGTRSASQTTTATATTGQDRLSGASGSEHHTRLSSVDGYALQYPWHQFLKRTTLLWFGLLFVTGALADTILDPLSTLTALGWMVTTVAWLTMWYLDMTRASLLTTWEPSPKRYFIGLLLPYVTIPYYAFKRWNTPRQESLRPGVAVRTRDPVPEAE